MPKKKPESEITRKRKDRRNVSMPTPLIVSIDNLILVRPYLGNRQQFIESAVREKIERTLAVKEEYLRANGLIP